MALSIATWNINSVRLRIGNVIRFIDEASPDVLCLQETKTLDEFFPTQAFEDRGYKHRLINGMKGYNGVAILSRLPLQGELATPGWCQKVDCRHGVAHLECGVEIHNLYIPAGGDIPDPEINDKFAHKLQFLEEITPYFENLAERRRPTVLVGDLNIAPLEHDVWSHKQLLSIVSHTPIEVEKLLALQDAGGFVDALRHFVPPNQKLYSWWSYRNRDWAASDRGRRLDHIWVTPDLVPHLAEGSIHREIRSWDGPSDHVPVIVRLDGVNV